MFQLADYLLFAYIYLTLYYLVQSADNYVLCFQLAPTDEVSLMNALKFIGNPFKVCERLQELMILLLEKVKLLKQNPPKEEGDLNFLSFISYFQA